MNKSMHKVALAVTALMLAGGASAATGTATMGATVIVPIAVAKVTDLAFGNLIAGNGDVTLSTSGARTKTGTLPLVLTGSTPTAAKFNITGQDAQTFSISTAGTSTSLTGPSTSTMPFSLILESVAATSTGKVDTTAVTAGTLTAGAAAVYVGGIVTVAAEQVAGAYTGTVSIAVEYN